MKNFQAITQASYLTAQHAEDYRRIMRLFFTEYEKMHFQLNKEEVLALLHRYPGYEDYSLDKLQENLASLVNWQDLTTIQDVKRVKTIAEYKNKQFRYSLSEFAVEIERLTVKLENLFIESGNLSTNLFERLQEALAKAEQLEGRPLKEVNEWWHNLQEDFKRLNQNYQDYLREFYSGQGAKVLKSLEFIQHKDLFVTYLKDFVKELKDNENQLARNLRVVTPLVENILLDRVVESELSIPHAASENREDLAAYIKDNVYGKWQSFKSWFLPESGTLSECDRVMEITNEVIRQIIQNAALLVQLQNWGLSRKEDYKKLLELFMQCEDLEEAHKLAAHAFGIQQVRHYRVNEERSTDSMNSSPYEEAPSTYQLKPRVRTYHSRLDKSGFPDRLAEKLRQREAYLAQVEADRRMVFKYIQGQMLQISAIKDCIPVSTRQTLLRWISLANTTSNKVGQTEYGQSFILKNTGARCVLHCEDGDLTMPDYIFIFS